MDVESSVGYVSELQHHTVFEGRSSPRAYGRRRLLGSVRLSLRSDREGDGAVVLDQEQRNTP
mgnify:CR=1 FL=1